MLCCGVLHGAGYSVDPKIVGDIAQMLSARPAILQIYGIQCEWVGATPCLRRPAVPFRRW